MTDGPMKIVMSLTYYKPNVSGVTIYVERLARGLVDRGHQVSVVASQHDPRLAVEEMDNGIHIVRVPVAARVSKGVIMPRLGREIGSLLRNADLLNLHLPMFDAAGLTARAKVAGKSVILTYHCDLQLPPSAMNKVVDEGVFAANYSAGRLADRIVAYTDDYAAHSRLLKRFPDKIEVIPPPVVMRSPSQAEVDAFEEHHGIAGRKVIGYASRFAAEKGIEVLIDGMPELLARYPDLTVLFAGPYEEVIGEEEYRLAQQSALAALGDHWKFVGILNAEQLPAFYGSLDTLLMTSVNMTESFGLVQVESMLCGTPVVASNLPGVRQPVLTTGMGVVTPIGDTPALVEGISRVLDNPAAFVKSRQEIEAVYDINRTIDDYEQLFQQAKR